jgi:hypothetical protein
MNGKLRESLKYRAIAHKSEANSLLQRRYEENIKAINLKP